MNSRRAAVMVAALGLLPATLLAQRLPSDDRKPPLTRKENWGLHLGIDMISAAFRPTRCESVEILPNGGRRPVVVPCEGQPNAYGSRGIGVGLNVGVVFLRHFLLGGEVWTVGFSGTRTHSVDGSFDVQMETTNSLAASAYIGVLSSPIGKGSSLGRKVWLGMLAGKSHWSGQRTCEPCVFNPLDMGRPEFIEPFAMFGGGDKDGGGGLRLAYRHHFGGFEAMHSTMTFGLFFAFGRM